jgi:hypothetical protein
MNKQPRKQFVINVDENSPEFRAHILQRLEHAKDPRNRISLDDFKKHLEIRQKARANA